MIWQVFISGTECETANMGQRIFVHKYVTSVSFISCKQKTMATSYYFQTQKSFSSLLLSVSLAFLLLPLNNKVVNSLENVSFSFSKFSQDQQNLILQGDALITSTGKLQLTKVNQNGRPLGWSLGRALYSAPIHMWDSTTGNVASFVTTFSFLINTPNKASMADGLAFFISKVDTQPQSGGGMLGIFNDINSTLSKQTVAVEFDTLHNRYWDPTGRHIGIDVDSIESISTVPWNFLNDTVADVVISYRAPTNALSVTMVYPSVATSYVLSDVVILKEVLPEWVRIGFSATTGLAQNNVETNDILSWTFHSELRDSNDAHPSSSILHEPI